MASASASKASALQIRRLQRHQLAYGGRLGGRETSAGRKFLPRGLPCAKEVERMKGNRARERKGNCVLEEGDWERKG